MPWWLVLPGLGVAILAGWLVLTWLLNVADSGDPQAAMRIDAIRTGLTVVAGTGGAVALPLAARRQWINERAQRHEETVASNERVHRERAQGHLEAVDLATQQHQDRLARAAEHDATERRVTELHTKAVDLLGNDRQRCVPAASMRWSGWRRTIPGIGRRTRSRWRCRWSARCGWPGRS